jgi:arylformamidase
MPYILSPIIKEDFQGMWFEGNPYKKETIYDIHSTDPKAPPVNYSAYTLKPHSLPHIEGSAHTQKNGKTVDAYFKSGSLSHFWGKALVVKLKGNGFKPHPTSTGINIWEVSLNELKAGILSASGNEIIPQRLILTVDSLPKTTAGLHDPNFVLILSLEAAQYLTTNSDFCLYGTSWKSSDFQPGSKERPIHNTLFKNAVIMECLDLKDVPEGQYFMNAFPIPLEGASESPVCPVLFTKEEILEQL